MRRAVHGPDVENRRGPKMADDPNGPMKAARDAMNKTVVSQFENSVVLTALARVGGACYA